MAITVQEKLGWQGAAKADGTREYTREFLITVPDADLPVTEVSIALLPGVPRKYDPVGPQDLGALCIDLELKEQEDSPNFWTATAKYSTIHGDPAGPGSEQNPLLRPAIWRYTSVRGTKTEAKDRQDNAYETTAGEPLSSPPEFVHSTSRYTVTRDEATFSGDTADDYASTVNDAPWFGKAKWTVLCEGITADEEWENGVHFFRVTRILHVDRNGWMPVKVANKGFVYLDGPGGNELQSDTLIWLAADGTKWVAVADPESDKYRDRYPYDERDFDAFNL